MSSTEKSPRDAAQAGAPPAATRLGAMDALERIAAIQLSNRFIWLAAAIGGSQRQGRMLPSQKKYQKD